MEGNFMSAAQWLRAAVDPWRELSDAFNYGHR
jgi:hypothetical protein